MNIGIDIGTYSIRISILKNTGPEILLDETENREMLNVISFNKIRKIGNLAIESTKKNSENTIFSLTRFLNKNSENFKEEINFCNFSKKHNTLYFKIKTETKTEDFCLEELLGGIFSQLKSNLNNFSDEDKIINISFPSNYRIKQKLTLIHSSYIGGFNKINLISEEMAIINQFIEIKKNSILPKNLIFIDFGYSKFRIYYVFFINDIVQSIFSDCIEIGVYNFDQGLFNYLTTKFFSGNDFNILDQNRLKYRLWKEIQKKRKILSSNQTVEICLESFIGDLDLIENVSRELFEQININLINRLKIFILKSQNEAMKKGFNLKQINEIQKLGGGSRIPFFEKIIKNLFKKHISKNFNLEEALSKGLAIFPSEGTLQNFYKINEDIFLKVFNKNTKIFEVIKVFPKNTFYNNKNQILVGNYVNVEIYSEREIIYDLLIFSNQNMSLDLLLNQNGMIEILNLKYLKNNCDFFEIKNLLGLNFDEINNLRSKELS